MAIQTPCDPIRLYPAARTSQNILQLQQLLPTKPVRPLDKYDTSHMDPEMGLLIDLGQTISLS